MILPPGIQPASGNFIPHGIAILLAGATTSTLWSFTTTLLLALLVTPALATGNAPFGQAKVPTRTAITVVMDDNYPPYVFRDADGTLTGYLIDSWALWEKKTGVHVNLLATDWKTAQQRMMTRHADVIDTVFRTPERERTLDFTPPYEQIPVAIYAYSHIGGITDLNTLRGFMVGVKVGDACVDKLEAAGIRDLQPYASYAALIDAAVAKKVRVFCMDEPPANYLLYHAQAEHEFNKAFRLYTGQFHRAVHKGDTATLALVERGFAAFTPAERLALHDKWMGSRLGASGYGRYVGYALLGMALIGGVLVLWIFTLRRVVKQHTAQLEIERTHLQVLIKSIPDLIWLKNPDGVYLSCNPMVERLFGASEAEIIGKTDYDFADKTLADSFREHDREALAANRPRINEEWLHFAADNSEGLFETIKTSIRDVKGKPIGVLGIARDITERKAAEIKIRRLTWLYAALSQCNQAIVHSTTAEELYPQICRAAVQFGGMKMAWIGIVDRQSLQVVPVAFYGDENKYLETIRISVDADSPFGRGPTGTAIREDRPFWCQDFLNDPYTAPWHEHAARSGWRSVASLPLHRNGTPIGAISFYVDTLNAFDEEVRNLLLELAIDIDFALDNLDRAAEHKRVEKGRDEALDRLQKIASRVPGVVYQYKQFCDGRSCFPFASEAFHQIFRIHPEAVREDASQVWTLLHPDDLGVVAGSIHESARDLTPWHQEFRVQFDDGTIRWLYSNAVPQREADESVLWHGFISDITERKQTEEHIQWLAHFDLLTGLPNRPLLNDRIKSAISMAQRNHTQLAVLFLDLDHFKNVNDTLGHHAGDQLLIEVANRLQQVVRDEDTVSRLGGDEFVLLLPGTDAKGAAHVAGKLLQAVAQSYQIEQHELTVTPSIGVALYPGDGEDFEILCRRADIAMYRAKRDGRNNFRFFTSEMQASSARNMQLENALRRALERDQLYLHYQPQMGLPDGRIVGAEALLRWKHPELGVISTAEFIPIAEDSGLILPIGEWVLRSATAQLKRWIDNGMEPMVVAVNLSAVQFHNTDLPQLITQILEEADLPAQYLELELTEGVAMDDPLAAIAVMDKLHERGIRMSIDDFGTGYSSLSYLKRLQVYKIKIDQSFVRDITIDKEDKAIVDAIISLARSLGLKTIAEGVETRQQLDFLRDKGCHEIQGYYYSKPLPADEFEAFVRAQARN
ncbi:MAG: EAL domain-containing protein [Sulfuriferula sp.]